MRGVLGEKLVGLYLYGSLVEGDFDPKISDIDMLAAVSSDLSQEEFEALKKMHDNFSATHKDWDNRIEVQYLSTSTLKNFKSQTNRGAVISPGEPFHFRDIDRHWLMNYYIVQEKGITLFGPPPKTIIEPISKEEFVDSIRDHTRSWNEWVKTMKSRKAQAYSILTMCRALYASEHGDQPSKKQAAEWAGEELPEWSELINNAMAWRESETDESGEESYAKTVEFVNAVRDRILR